MPAIYPNQLAQALHNQPSLVLLWGEDAGAIRQAAAQVVAASGLNPADPFAADKLDVQEVAANPAKLIDAATTLPFGAPRKLVQLVGATGIEDMNIIKNLTEAIQALLQFEITHTLVVLPLPVALGAKHPLVAAVAGAPGGLSVRFFADSARDLTAYVQGVLKTAGVRVDAAAQTALVAGLGADREIAARELEKLLLYVHPAGEITLADVQASLAGAPKVDVFKLADAVASRNAPETDKLIQLMLAEGEDLEGALNAVLRHLGQLASGHKLATEGHDTGSILAKLGKAGAPPEAKAQFTRQLQNYPAARLKTLPAYSYQAIATARKAGPLRDLALARTLLALSA